MIKERTLPFLALASKRVWKGLASCDAVNFTLTLRLHCRLPPTSGFADMSSWVLLVRKEKEVRALQATGRVTSVRLGQGNWSRGPLHLTVHYTTQGLLRRRLV